MHKVVGIIVGVVVMTSLAVAQRGGEGVQPAAQGGRQAGAPAQPLGRGAYQPTTWWGDEMFRSGRTLPATLSTPISTA